jgi:hypothetical protein
MDHSHSYLNTALVLLSVLIVGWALGYIHPPDRVTDASEPTPAPTAARCRTESATRAPGGVFVATNGAAHYTQIVPESDPRYERVQNDGAIISLRFDAGSVGPIAFRPDGGRIAFVGSYTGQKYIFEYTVRGVTPLTIAPIQQAWLNRACYTISGDYLAALAMQNGQWYLYSRYQYSDTPIARQVLYSDAERQQLIQVLFGAAPTSQPGPATNASANSDFSWLQ